MRKAGYGTVLRTTSTGGTQRMAKSKRVNSQAMYRPFPDLLVLALGLALVHWIWPESARELSIGLTVLFFAVGLWGVFSLRSGVWCKASWRGGTDSDMVALTYDDGPDPESTPPLLDLLASRGVRATFFCVGHKVTQHAELVRRIHAEGHVIGNHSQHHSNWFNFYWPKCMLAEVGAAQESIANVLGTRPTYYRPPVGLANHATGRTAKVLGVRIIGWQVRGFDLPGCRPERVARRILDRLRPGGIVLLHDGDRDKELVVEATRRVLDGIEERGLRAVSLAELLGDQL